MSLDPLTGVLTYDDGEQVDPSVPLAAMLSTPGAAVRRQPPWTWLAIPMRTIGTVVFETTLTFKDERLFSISLHRERPNTGRSWDSWSRADEDLIVAADEKWLDATVGSKRAFAWGHASAGFDERAATAYLILRYGSHFTSGVSGAKS